MKSGMTPDSSITQADVIPLFPGLRQERRDLRLKPHQSVCSDQCSVGFRDRETLSWVATAFLHFEGSQRHPKSIQDIE